MGIFAKIKKAWFDTIVWETIDDDFYDELEESLILADLGATVAHDAVKKLRDVVYQKSIQRGDDVKQALREILIEKLNVGDTALDLSTQPSVVLVIGVNGVGKTTSIGKLAHSLKGEGKRVLLCAADTFRAAAADQLEIWANRAECEIVRSVEGADPGAVLFDSLAAAKARNVDVVLCDTAGRLQIDEAMMEELRELKKELEPTEILLTIDAMAGQAAVDVAETFNEMLDITGVIVTKLDGDTRGGAALSVKYVTGKPIKFIGTGEKLDAIEPFYPDRMASRILGMGDMLSLIEKAEQNFDMKKAAELEEKLRKSRFTLTDYLDQMNQLKNMGSLESLVGMMPGISPGALKDANFDEKMIAKTEAIILSMTPAEREKPEIINYSRKTRIAKGSGTSIEEINRLLKQFDQTNKLMKQFAGGKGAKKFGKLGKVPFPR